MVHVLQVWNFDSPRDIQLHHPHRSQQLSPAYVTSHIPRIERACTAALWWLMRASIQQARRRRALLFMSAEGIKDWVQVFWGYITAKFEYEA